MTAAEVLTLFYNSFFSAFVLPLESEVLWFSWLAFRPESLWIATPVALIASAAGLMASYGIGRLVALDRKNIPLTETQYARATQVVNSYLVWLLMIPWVPFLGILALVCGFQRVAWWKMALLVFSGRCIYYGYYLFMG